MQKMLLLVDSKIETKSSIIVYSKPFFFAKRKGHAEVGTGCGCNMLFTYIPILQTCLGTSYCLVHAHSFLGQSLLHWGCIMAEFFFFYFVLISVGTMLLSSDCFKEGMTCLNGKKIIQQFP